MRRLAQHFQPAEKMLMHIFHGVPVSAGKTFLTQLGEGNCRRWVATVSICSCCVP